MFSRTGLIVILAMSVLMTACQPVPAATLTPTPISEQSAEALPSESPTPSLTLPPKSTPSITPAGQPTQTTLASSIPTKTPTNKQADEQVYQLAYVGTSDNTTDGLSEINTILSDGSNHSVVLSEAMLIVDLVAQPGGDKIAFWGCPGSISQDCFSNDDLDVWTVSWDGSHLVNLTEDSAETDSHPNWSPDGKQIVFDSWRSGKAEIYIMQADGSSVRQITAGTSFNSEPKWSPDGKWIAYHCMQDGEIRICVVSPDGQPAGEPIVGTTPYWSPVINGDESRLAYLCFNKQQSDICTARPDGSDVINLTVDPADEHKPVWSPDGSWIAFTSNRGDGLAVYKVCSTCTGEPTLVRLTINDSGATFWPAWSPDGEQVAYADFEKHDLYLVFSDGSRAVWLTDGDFGPPIWRPVRDE